nr:Dyp-type peroxidase domain-containing protein [Nocardioides ungokensis]
MFFLAYVRDPRTHFIPVQTRMAKVDALMEYLQVTGSALFVVPPGVGPGEHVGQALFA